jgi:multiple sugar transport system permease protein
MATTSMPMRSLAMRRKTRELILSVVLTGMALAVLGLFLMPMVYGIVTAVKTETQFSKTGAPLVPSQRTHFQLRR